MKILPHTAPYPFTLASLLGVSVGVVCGSCVSEGGSGVQVAHPRHRAGACTLNAVGLLSPVRVRAWRCEGRAPPCPTSTTLCVWRRLPYLTLPTASLRVPLARPCAGRAGAEGRAVAVARPGKTAREGGAPQPGERQGARRVLAASGRLTSRPEVDTVGRSIHFQSNKPWIAAHDFAPPLTQRPASIASGRPTYLTDCAHLGEARRSPLARALPARPRGRPHCSPS